MNELIQRLIDKVGLSEQQANTAMQTVVGFVKEKVPAPIAAQVETVLAGGSEGGGALGSISGALGGMFGKN
ncbi:hypothetical protein IM725_19705 [Ramlibacter aquaticus]|uniref:DUF2267 domain-containing protein n=1 Tax=Ramlibacter aquaticus TaxID=2780094 RepID=A0ABR9SKM1_9BURK|nr:hypothetical protein [Ramlibacter aquaticus]MBE7942800.1 hypothetical protein [Ramlibacter aquaticus]